MPLFDAHQGVVGPALRPHPFTSEASVPGAGVGSAIGDERVHRKDVVCRPSTGAPRQHGEDSSRRERQRDHEIDLHCQPTLLSLIDMCTGGSTRATPRSDCTAHPIRHDRDADHVPTVLIVDDDAKYRRALTAFLDASFDLDVIADTGSGEEAVAAGRAPAAGRCRRRHRDARGERRRGCETSA